MLEVLRTSCFMCSFVDLIDVFACVLFCLFAWLNWFASYQCDVCGFALFLYLFCDSARARRSVWHQGSGLELIIYVRSWPYSCLWRIAWPVPASVYICTATAIIKYKVVDANLKRTQTSGGHNHLARGAIADQIVGVAGALLSMLTSPNSVNIFSQSNNHCSNCTVAISDA